MRKRKVSVFIYSNIKRIQNMHDEGWTLATIHEDMQKDFGSEFSYNTFYTSLQRARKKLSLKKISNEKINSLDIKKEISKNNELEHKSINQSNSVILNDDTSIADFTLGWKK